MLGEWSTRREDRLLLAGAGEYLADLLVPGALEVCFVRSDRTHAAITGVDASAARDMPGVIAILSAEDLPATDLVDELHEVLPGLRPTPQPVLARDEVRFVGQAVAMVIAADRYCAEDAAELVQVHYTDLAPETRLRPGPLVYEDSVEFGDVSAAFAAAAHVTTSTLDTSRYAAVPLETRGCIAHYEARAEQLTVWSSTQSEFVLRRRLAGLTGLRESQIRVRVPDVGGGFGQKIPIHPEEVATVLAAMRLGRPLRWVEDRSENLLAAPHAKEQTLELRLAVAEDGGFLGLEADIIGDIGAYSFNSASGLIEPYVAARYLPGPYVVPAYGYRVRAALTNKSPVAPYRGTGGTAAMAALELLIEKHAQQTGADPYELRRRNLHTRSQFPFTGIGGKQFDTGTHREALDRAAELVDYPGFRERQRADRDRGVYRGLGLCASVESTGRPLVARWRSSYDAARLTLEMDGSLTLHLAVSAQGQGHHTTLARVAASAMGVHPEEIRVVSGDTESAPPSVYGTRASRTALMSGNAVHAAATELAERVLATAAEITGVDRRELALVDGAVEKEVGGVLLTLGELASRAYLDPTLRSDGRLPDFSVIRGFDAPIVFSNACYAVEVEVDPGTGRVRVVHVVAVEDCGTILNPLVVDGQVRGAVIQGIGGALLEAFEYDEDGQILTSTLKDYTLPRASDVPVIDVDHLCSESSLNPLGVKGVGESGSIGTPAAVAAAVQDALAPFGAEVQTVPLHPERVLTMLRSATPTDGSPTPVSASGPWPEKARQ